MFSPSAKKVLLVNPWVHDFAAYDFWMKPLGLLYAGSILRACGAQLFLLDCLHLPSLPEDLRSGLQDPKRRDDGRGHFYKEQIPKPEALRQVPRQYRRYGIPPARLKSYLAGLPRPDLVLVTSSMTYWYTGVAETVEFLRRSLPGVPILLGGTYATLCPEHARRNTGTDRVLPGPWDGDHLRTACEYLEISVPSAPADFTCWPYPAFDLYARPEYICLLTRCGCPFSCTYCASRLLSGRSLARDPVAVAEEVLFWIRRGVRDFAFYDDALLTDAPHHIGKMLRELMRRGGKVRFHTPNALHARSIDREIADLLFRSGFKTVRLGLETSEAARQTGTGGKVNNREFQRAVRNLKDAGFREEDIGVYLMAGLPGQEAGEVEESIAFVKEAGARPALAEYSPIPGTPLFEEAKRSSPYDLENEPLWHNNSLLPCAWEGFTREDLQRIKKSIIRAPLPRRHPPGSGFGP